MRRKDNELKNFDNENFGFLERQLADINIEELESNISQLEEKLFPEFKTPHEIPDIEKQKKDSLNKIIELHKQGIDTFYEGKLKAAENLFSDALRPALSKPSMKELVWKDAEAAKYELLDSMYHLGLIYLNDTSYTEHHAKAAAIFQYCAGFSVQHDVSLKLDNGTVGDEQYFLDRAYLIEKEFLKHVPNVEAKQQSDEEFCRASHKTFNDYKGELEKIRDDTKEELEKISSLTIGEIGERADAVKDIYRKCNSFFVNHDTSEESEVEGKGLVQKLLDECHEQLGGVPEGCVHSVIGLGSLSLGTMTPWSDLEFAILVDAVSKEYKDKIPEYKEYCRNFSKLLHIKIINLGETHLRSVGIEALNNFKTNADQDDWFWDDVVSAGFNFDGSHPHACKLPLGRQGYKNLPNFELILTPDEMAEFQKETIEGLEGSNWFETDKHLVQALKSVCLIDGDQKLLDEYRSKASDTSLRDIQKERVLSVLKENLDEFSLKLGDQEEGKLLDVKKNIYRLADRIIVSLSQYYDICAEEGESGLSVWQALKKMEEEGILSKEGAQHLKEALGVATELRLNTYSHNDAQREAILTYKPAVDHLTEEIRQQFLKETFYIEDTEYLKHFYYVMLEMQIVTQNFCDQGNHGLYKMILNKDNISHNTPYIKMMVHARFLEYGNALMYSDQVIKNNPKDINILNQLFFLFKKVSAPEKLLEISQIVVGLYEDHYKNDLNNLDVARSYNRLGIAYQINNQFDKAIEAYNKSLVIRENIYKGYHSDIFEIYNNIATIYRNKGEYNKSIFYYLKILNFKNQDDPETQEQVNIDITITMYNQANSLREKGCHDQAIKIHEKILHIRQKLYKDNCPNHPDIASSYNSLGSSLKDKGEYDKAIECHKKALAIREKFYGACPNHPDIAMSHNNLGTAYEMMENYNLTQYHHQEALRMRKEFYKGGHHLDIAASYNNLGNVFNHKKIYDKAENHFLLAMNLMENIYKNSPHPDLAQTYNNLGLLYGNQKIYEKAMHYYNLALKMRKDVHKNADHRDIIMSLNNIGVIYEKIGEYDNAIALYKEALLMSARVYKSNLTHPYVVASGKNLALAWNAKNHPDKNTQNYPKSITIKIKDGDNIFNIICNSNNPQNTKVEKLYESKLNQKQNIITPQTQTQEKKAGLIKDNTSDEGHLSMQDYKKLAISYFDLGGKCNANKQYEEAVEHYLHAVDMMKKAYPDDPHHKDIGACYNNLANVYRDNEDYEQAIPVYLHAIEIKLITLAPDHQDVLNSYRNLAVSYFNLGGVSNSSQNYEYAITIYQQAIEMMKKAHPADPNHNEIAACYNNLANVYRDKADYPSAIPYYLQAIEMKLISFSNNHNHDSIQRSRDNLKSVYEKIYAQHENCDEIVDVIMKLHFRNWDGDCNEHLKSNIIKLQVKVLDYACDLKLELTSLNCQKLLSNLGVDSESLSSVIDSYKENDSLLTDSAENEVSTLGNTDEHTDMI